YAIRGLVVTEEDQVPVDGANIRIFAIDRNAVIRTYDEDRVWNAVSDAKGTFRVEKLPYSMFALIAKKGNLAAVSSTAINHRETEDPSVTLELKPVSSIAGIVVNESQKPIADAIVALGQGKRGTQTFGTSFNQTKSMADGKFTLDYVEEGIWKIEAK